MGVLLGRSNPPEPAEGESPESPPEGVVLSGIILGGPAEKAGLRARDLVREIDGETVSTTGELIARVRARPPGEWIRLVIQRGSDALDKRLHLASRPSDSSLFRMREGWIGARAIDLPPKLRQHLGAPEDAGVMISRIEEGSPAEAAGLELGDVVYAVGETPVRNPRQLESRIIGGGVGNEVELTLARDGVEIVLEATIEQAAEERRRRRGPRRDRDED
jgi:serine protease Do